MEKASAEETPQKSPEETCKHVDLASLAVDPDVIVSREQLHKWIDKYSAKCLTDPLIMAYMYTTFGYHAEAAEKILEFHEQEKALLDELQDARDINSVREEEKNLQDIVDDSVGKVSAEVALLAIED
jgi:hypothetical protein